MIEFQGYDCKMVEIVTQFVPEIKFVAGAKRREKCEVEADYARDENREGLSSVKLEDSMVSIYPNTSGTSSTRFGMEAWNCDWNIIFHPRHHRATVPVRHDRATVRGKTSLASPR